MSYCKFVRDLPSDNVHKVYHDHHYGVPIQDDNELFGRLLLEINQAGLSWNTILNKQENFRAAYAGFNIAAVASFGEQERMLLLDNPGIIRNRLKVNAAIENAKRIARIQASHGSFKAWLDQHHPMKKDGWVKLFKRHFVFTGGEITGEFLMSTGYLPGAHEESCSIYNKVLAADPAWAKAL